MSRRSRPPSLGGGREPSHSPKARRRSRASGDVCCRYRGLAARNQSLSRDGKSGFSSRCGRRAQHTEGRRLDTAFHGERDKCCHP